MKTWERVFPERRATPREPMKPRRRKGAAPPVAEPELTAAERARLAAMRTAEDRPAG